MSNTSSNPQRGRYVIIGGPDGTGKTTLVHGLQELGLDFEHRHWRPHLLKSLRQMRGREELEVNPDPHGRTPDANLKSTVRALYYMLDFVLGYWWEIRPGLRAGRHYIIERGWPDMAIDPRRYGLPSNRVIRMCSPFVPRCDLAIVLAMEPALVAARKSELPEREIQRQLLAWSSHPVGVKVVHVMDASQPQESLAQLVAARIQAGQCEY